MIKFWKDLESVFNSEELEIFDLFKGRDAQNKNLRHLTGKFERENFENFKKNLKKYCGF